MRQQAFRDALAPTGLLIDQIELVGDQIRITGRSRFSGSICPRCGRRSTHIHSHYRRTLADLPSHGRSVRINLLARRFRCVAPDCPKRVFTERFSEALAPAFARRTARLERIVHHLGLALGGRPAASLARRLLVPVSKDTLLRSVRRHAAGVRSAPTIIGIDDWAWKRGQRYGTIICDLERRCIVDLLPDRATATVEAWLRARPGIRAISRDRGGCYGHAAARALPGARQVADRWHLMENASQAFLDIVRKSMRVIRRALGGGDLDPARLTYVERLQYDGYQRRQETDAAIRRLADTGMAIKTIVRATGYSRKTVRQVLRGGRADVFRNRANSLGLWLDALDSEWTAGCRNGAELWRRLKKSGFPGSLRVITEWATRRRRTEAAPDGMPQKCPSARVVARLLTIARDQLSRQDAFLVAMIEAAIPALTAVQDLVDRFHGMVQRQQSNELPAWIDVAAALSEPWSNGQTEGQITKLKLVKRQMYGRAKLDLLRARLVPPA
ncbi:MAG TPA: ISL3 family transposase [Terriglobia bacterium]|nr:ISL3 family transposase [Terriglobia bacterium]